MLEAIDRELGEGHRRVSGWGRLNPSQQGLHAWWGFLVDVRNGGLAQYYFNHTDVFVPALQTLLDSSGNEPMAGLLGHATAVYVQHKPEFQVKTLFGKDGLFERMTELAKLDKLVDRQLLRTDRQIEYP